jgi:hypothetical protein
MKWLLIQSGLTGQANENYRECVIMRQTLEELGQEAVVWGLNHANFESVIDVNKFDVVFTLENYGDGWMPDLASIKPYKIMWSIDAHVRGMEPFEHMFNQGKYNLMLNSTLDYVTQPHHVWFPNYVDNIHMKKLDDVTKTTFMGFCATKFNNNHPRNQVAEFLVASEGLQWDYLLGEAMVTAINSYNVHFNMNIEGDVNFRNFETLGCGTALLTNDNHQYPLLKFVDGENYFAYRSQDELVDKIKYLRNNPEEIVRVANNGLLLAQQHTLKNRMQTLIKYLERQ